MEPVSPFRRSQRAVKRKRAYTNDPFAGLERLLYSDDSGSSTSVDESPSDDDVQEHLLHDEAAHPSPNHDLDFQQDESVAHSPLTDDDDEYLFDVNALAEESADDEDEANYSARKAAERLLLVQRVDTPSSRGTYNSMRGQSTQLNINSIYGDGLPELETMILIRDRFLNSKFLPHIRLGKSNGDATQLDLFHTKKRQIRELQKDWMWYYDQHGRDRFQNLQRQHQRVADKPAWWPWDQKPISFLAGPIKDHTHLTLPPGQSLPVVSLFPKHKRARPGWVFNFGSDLQCLAWVPNRTHLSQLLCLAPRESVQHARHVASTAGNEAASTINSFNPRPLKSSVLYIYHIPASPRPEQDGRLDTESEPKLHAVLNFPWGGVLRFQWCPVPHGRPDNNGSHLGLLAVVFGDGYVRVLDITLPPQSDLQPVFLNYERCAFEAILPETVCTDVTWLSASTIAVGTAHGFVAAWNISRHLGEALPRPFFLKYVHQSHIHRIVSGYPSRPYLIFTNSTDGFVRMLDLRDAIADCTATIRCRVSQLPLGWLDLCQGVIFADDQNAVNFGYVRHFYVHATLTRWESTVLDTGVSPFHPYILMAMADGTVGVANFVDRMQIRKRRLAAKFIWFKYDWRPALAPDGLPAQHSAVQCDAKDVRPALGRFTEGIIAEEVAIDEIVRARSDGNVTVASAYEDKNAATHVSWNPNARFCTWAVATVAGGLLRIEDLAVVP